MRHAGFIIIVSAVAVTLVLFYLSKPDASAFIRQPFLTLSQGAALTGSAILAFVFVLSTRWRFLEPIFGGQDKVYRAHGINAAIAFSLLLEHAAFLIVHHLPDTGIVSGFILPGRTPAYTLGILSVWGFSLLVILTLYANLPYNVWKYLHAYMGVPYAFGIAHMLLIPSDISRFMPLRLWILGLSALGAAAYVYKRFIYTPLGPRYAYTVTSVSRIGDILDIRLSPSDKKLAFSPGQFVFLTAGKSGIPREDHPFSIASSPDDPVLQICAKIVGDYTLTLQTLKAGDTVTVSGPHGRFGRSLAKDNPVILVAGGIGITPFLSMIRAYAKSARNKPIHLFHTVKNPEESVGHDELVALVAGTGHIRYHRHVTRESGRLTAQKILETAGIAEGIRVLLCGPGPMMYDLSRQFSALGIRRRRIEFEDFNFR